MLRDTCIPWDATQVLPRRRRRRLAVDRRCSRRGIRRRRPAAEAPRVQQAEATTSWSSSRPACCMVTDFARVPRPESRLRSTFYHNLQPRTAAGRLRGTAGAGSRVADSRRQVWHRRLASTAERNRSPRGSRNLGCPRRHGMWSAEVSNGHRERRPCAPAEFAGQTFLAALASAGGRLLRPHGLRKAGAGAILQTVSMPAGFTRCSGAGPEHSSCLLNLTDWMMRSSRYPTST